MDYEAHFDSLALNLQGASDYLNSFVSSIKGSGHPPANAPQAFAWSGVKISPSLINGRSTADLLRSDSTFMGSAGYATYINAISNSLKNAATEFNVIVPNLGNINSGNVDDKTSALANLLETAVSNLSSLRTAYKLNGISADKTNNPTSAATDLKFPEIETLFKRLSDMLKERYRFNVVRAGIHQLGLLLNYRQKWAPQSYQVGSLVKTIPLGAGEVQKYTTKSVTKKSRNAKELDKSSSSSKEDKSVTQRVNAGNLQQRQRKDEISMPTLPAASRSVCTTSTPRGDFGKDQGVNSRNTKRDQARIGDQVRAGVP